MLSVKQIIENGSVLEMRTPNGGRLKCQLGGRPVFENDGRLSDSQVLNLPFGAISIYRTGNHRSGLHLC